MAVTKEFSRQATRKRQAYLRKRQETISKIMIGFGVLVILTVLFVLLGNKPVNLTPPVIGQPMSNISLTSLDGKQVSLADYKGKPVLINTWATWCPPCKAEMPAIEAFYQAHKDEGFTVLAINDGESQSQVQGFITAQKFTFPVLLDPNMAVLNALGIDSFPTSILVGRDGIVKGIHIGMFTEDQLNQEVGALLK